MGTAAPTAPTAAPTAPTTAPTAPTAAPTVPATPAPTGSYTPGSYTPAPATPAPATPAPTSYTGSYTGSYSNTGSYAGSYTGSYTQRRLIDYDVLSEDEAEDMLEDGEEAGDMLEDGDVWMVLPLSADDEPQRQPRRPEQQQMPPTLEHLSDVDML